MSNNQVFRVAAISAVKHDYVARGVVSHPRFEMVVVTDDEHVPQWAHERNQQLADAYGVPYIPNIERAIEMVRPEVAVVSSEAYRHAQLSCRAVHLGLHVVQDKPLSTHRQHAQELVDAVAKHKTKFMMWNRNCLPAIRHALQQVNSGVVGRIVAVHADFYFAKDAGPPKGSRQPGYPPMSWQAHQIAAHSDGSDGGLGPDPIGELANEGIYPLGYMFAMTAARPKRVFATSTAHFHQLNVDNQVEDLAGVTIEMDDGSVGTIALGRIGLASHPSGGEIKLRIVGEAGSLVVREACPDVAIYYRQQPTTEARQRRVANENDFLLAEHFAQAIDNNSQPFMNVADSLCVFETIDAALQSCRTGQPVSVMPISSTSGECS